MSTQHTPTPFQVKHSNDDTRRVVYIADAKGDEVCTMPDASFGPRRWIDANNTNATFIVRACNSHDALVAALREIANADVDPAFWRVRVEHLRTVARAALAAAEGK